MTKSHEKLPGVLSFQRCFILSDGLFYNVFADGRTTPLMVMRHGIRGTQNVNTTGKKKQSSVGSEERSKVFNPQTTDTAKLDSQAKKLRVKFDLRFVDLKDALFSCASGEGMDIKLFREQVVTFIAQSKESDALKEVACRYARNIANGRFLWRNRAVAEKVQIQVSFAQGEKVNFNSLDITLNSFDNYSEAEIRIADEICKGLRGNREAVLRIEADVDFGIHGGLEVFPSQNYLEEKTKGFARSLYCVGNIAENQDKNSNQERGQAALRDQKIGNALRTIDTWYPEYESHGLPLPVEPNGASLDAQRFFRNTKETSGFQYLLRVGTLQPDTDEGMFLLACIIRGGVFSGSE